MTALERWQTGTKETVFQVRLTAAQEAKVRELSAKFNLPVSQVIRDLMCDGLTVFENRIQI
jgi:hypothetical protein